MFAHKPVHPAPPTPVFHRTQSFSDILLPEAIRAHVSPGLTIANFLQLSTIPGCVGVGVVMPVPGCVGVGDGVDPMRPTQAYYSRSRRVSNFFLKNTEYRVLLLVIRGRMFAVTYSLGPEASAVAYSRRVPLREFRRRDTIEGGNIPARLSALNEVEFLTVCDHSNLG